MTARTIAAAVAAAAALVAGDVAARAGSCGGGGDSGGGSSGGGSSGGDSSSDSGDSGGGDSSDSSYDSGSTSTAAPACVETSDVVGHQQCGRFGTWQMPRVAPFVSVELGSSVRTFSMRAMQFSGRVDHGDHGAYTYRVTGGDLGADVAAVTADSRILVGRRVYGGVEASVGGVAGDEGQATEAMAGATMRPSVTASLTGGGVLGARLRVRQGRRPITLSAEVFAGVQTVMVEVHSQYLACDTTSTSSAHQTLVEPRLRAEAWLSPWMTVGAFAGSDLLHPGGEVMGVYLGAHVRAFDGVR
ncbi:MAG: hypothetical protein H6708_16910 [Kofleriaceae bacterium]|nr:hypothetical protein [Kofleriaceae bacterium]